MAGEAERKDTMRADEVLNEDRRGRSGAPRTAGG